MRTLSAYLVVVLVLSLSACAGSTSFLDDTERREMTLAPGISDTAVLEFEAVGSHAGTFEFSVTPTFGDGVSGTVDPPSAEVDGVLELIVTVTADDDAEPGEAAVFVEGSDGDTGAGTTIWITIE